MSDEGPNIQFLRKPTVKFGISNEKQEVTTFIIKIDKNWIQVIFNTGR